MGRRCSSTLLFQFCHPEWSEAKPGDLQFACIIEEFVRSKATAGSSAPHPADAPVGMTNSMQRSVLHALFYIISGALIPSHASERISSRCVIAVVANRNFFRSGSVSVRM